MNNLSVCYKLLCALGIQSEFLNLGQFQTYANTNKGALYLNAGDIDNTIILTLISITLTNMQIRKKRQYHLISFLL